MNRRKLLTAAVASATLPSAALAAGVDQAAHPDAGLIAVCTEYLRIQWAFEAHFDNLPGDMADDDPAWSTLAPLPALVQKIVGMRAVTAEGLIARGRCMAFHFLPQHSACRDDPDAATEDRFSAALLRDLVVMERPGA